MADALLPTIRQRVLKELDGGLWHSTHPGRFKAILRSGAVLPEPPIANPDGWVTLSGESYRSFARNLGGVSLFDFYQFDPKSYQERCPMSSWDEFVPYREKWGGAVWIEIDRQQIASQFISGDALVERWKSEKAYEHNFMPYIEAVHLGPVPRAAFKRAFLVQRGNEELQHLSI
ncbi:MAG: hypothetical protein WBQ09_16670 [Terriglobales bacterium]